MVSEERSHNEATTGDATTGDATTGVDADETQPMSAVDAEAPGPVADSSEGRPLYRNAKLSAAAAAAGATAARAKDSTGAAALAAKNAVKARLKQADAAVTQISEGQPATSSSATTVVPAATAAPPATQTGSGGGQVSVPHKPLSGTPMRRTRKARLRLSRLDPWSVMKTTFMFAIAGAIVAFVATWVIWGMITASGVFESVNQTVNDLVSSPGSEDSFRLEDWVNTHRILGFTAMTSAINVVLITALATLGSFLYNLAATVLGGLEVTLAED